MTASTGLEVSCGRCGFPTDGTITTPAGDVRCLACVTASLEVLADCLTTPAPEAPHA